KRASLAAYPNASLPAYRDGVLFYENEPDYFTNCAVDLRNQGVRLIGGCCGTTPEHVRALKNGIEGLAPITEKVVKASEETLTITKAKKIEKTLAETAEVRITITVECDVPKHIDIA